MENTWFIVPTVKTIFFVTVMICDIRKKIFGPIYCLHVPIGK